MIFFRRIKYIFFISILCLSEASALVTFDDVNLSADNALLFTVKTEVNGSPSYKAVFETVLSTKSPAYEPKILTCFPEKMETILGGSTLQIRNRWGTARLNVADGSLSWTASANRIPVEYTHVGSRSVSPDGKWSCFVKQTKNAKGVLVLQETATLKETVLSENAPFTFSKPCAKWSSDSKCLLYEKNGSVYFITPESAFKSIQINDDYRKIGSGFISSVEWTESGSLLYINGDIVYRINQNELYTRGLYSSIVGSGKIIGRLPRNYNSATDRFFCDVDGTQLVQITGDNLLNYFSLGDQGYDFVHIKGIYSLTGIKGTPLDYCIFWTSERKPVLWIDMLSYSTGKRTSSVYSLYGKMNLLIDVIGCRNYVLSPDRERIAFSSGNSLYVYDTTTWQQCAKVSGEKIVSLSWITPFSIAAGGVSSIKQINFNWKEKTVSEKMLYISSAEKPFFDAKQICIQKEDGTVYAYDKKTSAWKFHAVQNYEKRAEKNGSFRVFELDSKNPRFANSLYVRSLSRDVITYPVYPETEKAGRPLKKAALIFDAVDTAEGTARILNELEEFGIKGTFFFNGEFIRRYPMETKQIASSGNYCASIFYSTANLLEKSFVIDSDFIKRGLARNEDEFCQLTGKELSLLWHAPYYNSEKMMKTASKQAGYTYVDAFTKYMDNVTFEKSASEKIPYLSASELIDGISDSLYDGIIIPVNAGRVEGTRKDYLYEHLDLLISAILDSGYEITDAGSILASRGE
ncbi:MAG: polysaccharide deacetylase family protein [Treponema sp.]|nr:polysaccharide deacetylase family protein [Treponema sp.]